MPLEHSPARQGERAAYTTNEFCHDHRVSRSKLYEMWREGTGPRFFTIGNQRRISVEAAANWRREREAAAEASA